MRRDIQDALLSVAEVAIFAWSLLELLLTRILPLAGFLAGHLLLAFGSLLTSVVIRPAAAGRRRTPRAEYSWDVQAEELIEEDAVDHVKEDISDGQQNNAESLKSSDKLIEESPSVTEDEEIDAAPYDPYSHAHRPVIDHHAAANEAAQLLSIDYGHLAESSPSDDQVHRNVGQSQPSNLDVAAVEQGHVSSKADGKTDLEPSTSSGRTSEEEATSPATEAGEMRQSSSMRRRSRRIRVLPPSLSQVKRTIMQRSRRASPASTSPALLAPSPSPIKKKQQRGSRSSAIRASASSDNFMRKFKKHFLLDAA